MTIAKRLSFLLAVPLVALVALAVFSRFQLSEVERLSRFVAEKQIPSLAALGNIAGRFAELRVELRNYVLAVDDAQRARVKEAFDRDEAQVAKLIADYEPDLISDERDRQLLNDYRSQYREWMARAKEIISLGAVGRREEAAALLRDASTVELGTRLGN